MDMQRPDDWDQPVQIPPLDGIRHILVPFDGSHNAERALAFADLVGAGLGTEIIVVTAYEPPLTKKGRGAIYVEDIQREQREEAHELVTEAVDLLLARGRTARGIVVRGEPALAIIDTAETEGVDVIVMGRRGLTSEMGGLSGTFERFRTALTGSVADRVTHHSDAVVIAVG